MKGRARVDVRLDFNLTAKILIGVVSNRLARSPVAGWPFQ